MDRSTDSATQTVPRPASVELIAGGMFVFVQFLIGGVDWGLANGERVPHRQSQCR